MNNKKTKSYLCAVFGIIMLVIIDQITKVLAVSHLKNKESVTLIPKIISLTYLENYGAAWGIFQNKGWLFILITVLLMIFLTVYYSKLPFEKHFRLLKITLIVLFAGAVGNMIDRIMHNYVIDFFEFKFISFPIFNVADIYITCSIVFLIVLIFFVYSEKEVFLEGNKDE